MLHSAHCHATDGGFLVFQDNNGRYLLNHSNIINNSQGRERHNGIVVGQRANFDVEFCNFIHNNTIESRFLTVSEHFSITIRNSFFDVTYLAGSVTVLENFDSPTELFLNNVGGDRFKLKFVVVTLPCICTRNDVSLVSLIRNNLVNSVFM